MDKKNGDEAVKSIWMETGRSEGNNAAKTSRKEKKLEAKGNKIEEKEKETERGKRTRESTQSKRRNSKWKYRRTSNRKDRCLDKEMAIKLSMLRK